MDYQFAQAISPKGVDRNQGVIKGVSVITEGPALGHGVMVDGVTLRQVVETASKYAGGLKVVDSHVTGQHSIFATVGYLKNFRIEGPKVLADLYPLKSEQGADKLFEMAETIPDTFGLSIAFSGASEVVDGSPRARCSEIYNAALVDTPAANPSGLFSKKVDGQNNYKFMATEQDFSQFSQAFSEFTKTSEARFAKLEAAIEEIKSTKTECSALEKKVTELSAVIDGAKKEFGEKKELVQLVAKEFAGVLGTSPNARQREDAAQTQAPAETDPVHFIEAAKKNYAAGNVSELEAMKLAMKQQPKSYATFRDSGKRLTLK